MQIVTDQANVMNELEWCLDELPLVAEITDLKEGGV